MHVFVVIGANDRQYRLYGVFASHAAAYNFVDRQWADDRSFGPDGFCFRSEVVIHSCTIGTIYTFLQVSLA